MGRKKTKTKRFSRKIPYGDFVCPVCGGHFKTKAGYGSHTSRALYMYKKMEYGAALGSEKKKEVDERIEQELMNIKEGKAKPFLLRKEDEVKEYLSRFNEL